MKQLIRVFVISLLLCSCSGGGSEDEIPVPPPAENKAPSKPILTYPTNNLLCINNVLDFEWNASTDSDGDALSYKIEIATDIQFSQIAFSSDVSGTNKVFTLEKGKAYYWRVKATDSKNKSSEYSSTFNFYTEGEGISNHLPFAPELVKPEFNSKENSGDITLEWIGSDTDNDPLTFDIYFGSNDEPELISQNQSEQNFKVSTTANNTYYWKVVVKDNKGGETIGQLWKFNTN